MVSLADIALARYRIAPHLAPTPLEDAPGLGEQVYLKLENANKTHSFKIRGALNALLALDESARKRGIVAASSGNHAQALAYAAKLIDVQARIVMPAHTPKRKINGVRHYGAQAIVSAENYDEAEHLARQMERDDGLTFVSAYNDAHVIAGQGTIGIEIVEQLPNVRRVIVPTSGGGLIGGVGVAIKSLRRRAQVIGVNAESAPAMYNQFYNTQQSQVWDTLAEALSGDIEAGSITIPLAKQVVDDIVLVSEAQIAEAMRWMLDEQGWLIEGGGAVGIAALLHGVIPADGTPTAIVVSGGNVDGETVRRILAVSN